MAYLEGKDAISQVRKMIEHGGLRGKLYQEEGVDIPIRALISSAEISGNKLELHSLSYFHLNYSNGSWSLQSDGDINTSLDLEEVIVIGELGDGYVVAYRENQRSITLS
jgi:hypothetical protein